jgi:hypothetical protein
MGEMWRKVREIEKEREKDNCYRKKERANRRKNKRY